MTVIFWSVVVVVVVVVVLPGCDMSGWVVDSAGKVFSFGDAAFHGSVKPASLQSGETVVSLSPTPSGAAPVSSSRSRSRGSMP